MVVIDGHDATWQSQFRVAAGDDTVMTLSLVHVDLSQCSWEWLILQRRRSWNRFEIVECHNLEAGLPSLLGLKVGHIYVRMRSNSNSNRNDDEEDDDGPNTTSRISTQLGRILGVGLRDSSTTLAHLHLSDGTWTSDAMRGIAQGVQSNASLLELDLSYTDWPVSVAVSASASALASVTASDTDDSSSMELLAKGIARNTSLTTLKFNRCRLTDLQVATLMDCGIYEHPTIQTVYLGGNEMKDHAMAAIQNVLESPNCSIATLGLSNPLNGDDDDAGDDDDDPQRSYLSILWRALPHNDSLETLHLASNQLQDDCIPALAEAVGNSSIRTLDLKSNKLTDHGIATLAAHFPPQLERLWLLGNPMSVPGALALLDALTHSHTCMVLLQDLRIPTYSLLAAVPELEQIQKQCHYFQVLNRGGRRILTSDKCVPLALWALILARVNELDFHEQKYDTAKGRLEGIYHLLHGPALLDR
jgi:hypothetical protein